MLDKKPATGSAKRVATGKRGYRWRKAPARRPTMVDVANEARVSQTTVSLVLNHADGARLSHDPRAGAQGGGQTRLSGGAARRRRCGAAASTIGFVCDEISTDPWTSIGFDGVREKAWADRGLTVTVTVTRGDVDMEAAAFAQLASMPLVGLIFATVNTRPSIRRPDGAAAAAELSLGRRRVRFRRSRRGRGRPRRHRCPDPRRPQAHWLHQWRTKHGGLAPSLERLSSRPRTADLPFDPELVRDGNWQPLSGYEATRELMSLPLVRRRFFAPTT